jgi:hypothetical protein
MEGAWVQDKTATHCKACSKEFNLTRRKVGCLTLCESILEKVDTFSTTAGIVEISSATRVPTIPCRYHHQLSRLEFVTIVTQC